MENKLLNIHQRTCFFDFIKKNKKPLTLRKRLVFCGPTWARIFFIFPFIYSTFKHYNFQRGRFRGRFYVFERLFTISRKLFKALSKLSIISCDSISGSGKISKSTKLSSFNQNTSKLSLSLKINSS